MHKPTAKASPLTGCKAKAAPKDAPATKAAGVRMLLNRFDASPEKSLVSAAATRSTLRQGGFRLEVLMARAGAMKDEQSKNAAIAISVGVVQKRAALAIFASLHKLALVHEEREAEEALCW